MLKIHLKNTASNVWVINGSRYFVVELKNTNSLTEEIYVDGRKVANGKRKLWNRYSFFVDGKLVVITTRPSWTMTIKHQLEFDGVKVPQWKISSPFDGVFLGLLRKNSI